MTTTGAELGINAVQETEAKDFGKKTDEEGGGWEGAHVGES